VSFSNLLDLAELDAARIDDLAEYLYGRKLGGIAALDDVHVLTQDAVTTPASLEEIWPDTKRRFSRPSIGM